MKGSRTGTVVRVGPVPGGRWEWRLTVAILAVVAVRTALLLQAAWPHTTDDAYITLRYARHLASGAGLLWNVGEAPVEGYSNFLFVALGAALLGAKAVDPMSVFKALGGAALFASAALTFVIGRRWLGPAAATVPAVLLTGYGGSALWAVSGLETAVYQLLVLLAVLLVLLALESTRSWRRNRLFGAAGLVGFLLSLARPEGPVVVFVLLIAVALVSGDDGRRQAVRAVGWLGAPFLALYAPYTLWRVAYFGRLLPNAVACKAGYVKAPFELIGDFFSYAWVYVALAAVALVFRRDARHPLVWGIPTAYLVILFRVDPIMSHHNRHFLAALPFVLLAATIGLQQLVGLPERWRERRLGRLLVAVVVVAGAVATHAMVRADVALTASRNQPPEAPRLALADYLTSALRDGDVYVIGDSGLVPYRVGGAAIDAYCLNCRAATRPDLAGSPERFADWILAQRPRFVIVQSLHPEVLQPVWDADVALAAHPALRSAYERVRTFGGGDDVFHYVLFERVGG